MLSAEIIAIGSELLSPNRTDTNSLWLTDQLNRIVGDDDARLEEVVKDAVKRSRVVITTGPRSDPIDSTFILSLAVYDITTTFNDITPA